MGDAASAIPALRRATASGAEAKALARLAKDPLIARQMDGFAKAVAKAPDLKTALRDPRVLNVLLPAMGMPDAVGQAGLAQRALTADPADTNGLLSRLSDTRWKTAAQTLNLAKGGIEVLRDPKLQATLSEGLRRLAWQYELSAGQAGLGDALVFQERAATAKTAYDVLGDPVLRRVVTTALGLPQQIAVQSVEAQARAVASRLDIGKLQNPKEVAKLAERYVVAAAGTSSSASGTAVSLLSGLLA